MFQFQDGPGSCEFHSKTIGSMRKAIPSAETIEAIRLIEARGAYAYWGAWNNLPINFPRSDLRRVPDHWRVFRNRVPPLTGSPRLATNPINAALNYLYAVLESESRLAVAALGLDPGLGVMHMDAPSRDSLAFDVMEPVRPLVDAYLLNWIRGETLKCEWLFEQRDDNCRLMGNLLRLPDDVTTTFGSVDEIQSFVAFKIVEIGTQSPPGRAKGHFRPRLTFDTDISKHYAISQKSYSTCLSGQ